MKYYSHTPCPDCGRFNWWAEDSDDYTIHCKTCGWSYTEDDT